MSKKMSLSKGNPITKAELAERADRVESACVKIEADMARVINTTKNTETSGTRGAPNADRKTGPKGTPIAMRALAEKAERALVQVETDMARGMKITNMERAAKKTCAAPNAEANSVTREADKAKKTDRAKKAAGLTQEVGSKDRSRSSK